MIELTTLTFESNQDCRNTAGVVGQLLGVTLNLVDEDCEVFTTVDGEGSYQVTVKPNPDRDDEHPGLCYIRVVDLDLTQVENVETGLTTASFRLRMGEVKRSGRRDELGV